ncbi:lantibiotic dehydratase [Streptomyces abikoensis]|uniref:lantibiotic dehydratase n=1 Tax=Streptomyces abikoensis TaxID=97398 RepID=UPI0037135ACA
MLYRNVGAALVRAVAYPGGWEPPPWPSSDIGELPKAEHLRQWIKEVWASNAVAEAVEVATPALARRLRGLCAGDALTERAVRRAAFSLLRYLLRTQSRATPFGLFAGVAPTHFGPGLSVQWGENHHAVARADAAWLADVVTRLEACPELLRRLPVRVDPTCFVQGDRVVVPCQQPRDDGGPAEVSVRRSRATEIVLRAAQSPLRAGDLADKLTTEYPETSAEVIEGLVTELVRRRVLISGLHPPMTATDALGHVVQQLSDVDASAVPPIAPVVRQLYDLHGELAAHNCTGAGRQRHIRSSVSGKMAALSGVVEQPLAVDLRLDCSLVLPDQVGREAEKAVTALAALTPFPHGRPAWQEYHTRFLERYGIGAAVPVLDVVDPGVGLGFPAGYRGSLLESSRPRPTARDERLLELAQEAVLDGEAEVVLTERIIEQMAAQDSAPRRAPAHTQLTFSLMSPTRSALEDSTFDLVVTAVSSAAGTTAGRFLGLLDDADRDRMTAVYSTLPTLDSGALLAQVSCPPLRLRTENVSRAPVVLPHVIPVAEHGGSARELPLDDLAVSGDRERLYLVSLSQGRAVEPMAFNAVEPTNFTHPLARFLCAVPRARAAVLAPFSWGAVRLPFLPRVRYGRTVLMPASWRLATSNLAPPTASWSLWEKSLMTWRDRFRVPDVVYLGDYDRRLLLHLDDAAHLHLLRAQVDKAGHATLREAPDATAYGWLDGRAHEITMALASTSSERPPVPRWTRPPIEREHGHLPGASEWAFVKLYGHPARVPDLLITHLPALWEAWGSPPAWWYVRYRDPEPHLRLRIHLPDADDYGEAVHRVGAWAAGLRSLGLVGRVQWDTYYPETGRYGAGAAMAAAEKVFAADSASAVAQLRTPDGEARRRAVTAASLLDVACALTGGTPAGAHWLTDHIAKSGEPAPDRGLLGEAVLLANPTNDFEALRSRPHGEEIITAWARRRTALAVYREQLTAVGEPSPESVLLSLLHMHHIRVAGIDEDCERLCRRLARSAALSLIARGAAR